MKVTECFSFRYHQPDEIDKQSVVTDVSAIEALLVDMFQADFLKLLNKFQYVFSSSFIYLFIYSFIYLLISGYF